MKKQAGFGVIGVIAVVVVLAVVAGAGYVVYKQRSSSTEDSSKQASNNTLAITEWDVSLENAVADKLTYAYQGASSMNVQGANSYESAVTLKFKEGAVRGRICAPNRALLRSTTQPNVTDVKKVGDYYYWSVGGKSFGCSIDSDSKLAQGFKDSFDISKLE